MEWIANNYDPRLPDARCNVATINFYDSSGKLKMQTKEEAWKSQQEWLKGKIIGRPKATSVYTVEQLESMGIIGVYVVTNDNT